MRTLICQALLVSLVGLTGCKRSGEMPFSYTVSRSGSITMSVGKTGQKVEIVTDDYELTVNGVPYGKIDEGDLIMVKSGEVYRNGAKILPTAESGQSVDESAGEDSGGNG
ncbi:MAG: hypothetical protein HKN82_08265 [Akkermansiaceae bacterium]|nr:hypothetical protein [Akkermansiaceae bacterium]NNM30801.1 hypothetical protein [Akkermansiaceae bacterium]